MIKRVEQSVVIMGSLTQEQMLANLGVILGTPYDKGNYNSEKTIAVLKNCIKRGHESVLEHLNITTVSITNIGVYKGITRHRHCAFTIESTSFVDYSDCLEVITKEAPDLIVLETLLQRYQEMENRKSARDYLPQCAAAKMVMTTNIREWRHILGLRSDPNDNPLTNEWCQLVLDAMQETYPLFFKEIPVKQVWV